MTRAQNKLGSGRRGRRPADSDGLTPLRPSPAHTPHTPEPTYSLVPAFLITFTRHFHSNDIITLRNLYPTQRCAFNIIHNLIYNNARCLWITNRSVNSIYLHLVN